MKLSLKLAFLGLSSVFIILLTACASAPEIRSDRYLIDDSVITGDPCAAPCWRGITPGETAWEDAVISIQDDPELNNFEQRADEETEARGAAWGREGGDRCCQMFSQDGETVSFIILQTTPARTLGEAVEVHGEPDYLIGEPFTDTQALFSLFYTDVPMILYVFVAGESGAISETSEIVGFAYATPEDMQLIVDTNNLHAWEGYQGYSAYIDGEFEVTPRITLTPSDGDES
ncbi:MAG: hypothetical protein OHK0046_26800 [Anaerolineae bacterium]